MLGRDRPTLGAAPCVVAVNGVGTPAGSLLSWEPPTRFCILLRSLLQFRQMRPTPGPTPMTYQTDDLRIKEIRDVTPPTEVHAAYPITEAAAQTVYETREAIHQILEGADDRLLVVIGGSSWCARASPRSCWW